MVIKDIIQLMNAVQETNFDSFELKDKDFELKLERNQGQGAAAQAAPAPTAQPPAAPAEAEDAASVKTPGGKDVVSPLVGVYHEMSGGKAVKIGDKLKKGDAVCMVEAMKLMNEINMPEDGEVVWVACAEGDTVEYEQLLFRYI